MFDPSAPHIIILLVVVLLLFGAGRLPGAAEALGKSMRIFKSETKKMHDEAPASQTEVPPALVAAPPAAAAPAAAQAPAGAQAPAAQAPAAPAPAADPAGTEEQIAHLQRQLADLRREQAGVTIPGAPAGTR